jgi:hypothetical protein
MTWRLVIAAAVLALAASAAGAQQQTVRVTGTIESFNGRVLALKSNKLGAVTVALTADATVFGVARATLADIKPGAFVGVGAIPQSDGSQRAIQVTVFAEVQRGVGEGHRPWDREPGSTMTNATIESVVDAKDGETLLVKYKDGEKKIVVPPEAAILAYAVGSKDELKPGAHVVITRALKQPDGSLETNRVNVGRGGVVPQ